MPDLMLSLLFLVLKQNIGYKTVFFFFFFAHNVTSCDL